MVSRSIWTWFTTQHRVDHGLSPLRHAGLGRGPIVFDPLPGKPPRMHRRTYFRVLAAAIKAQERAFGLDVAELRRRFPAVISLDPSTAINAPSAR
jgi:hypothetical protein